MTRIETKDGKSENKKSDPTSIGERIRFVRGDLSQIEFGDMLGAPRSTVRRWERGLATPSNEILVRFMDLLHVDLLWLFSGKGKPYLDDQEQRGKPDRKPKQSIC